MKKLFFGLFAAGIILSSCQKSEIENPNNSEINQVESISSTGTEGISNVDGRVVFKDEETFLKHQDWIIANEEKPELINSFYNKLGIKTMMNIYDGQNKIKSDKELKNYCESYPGVFEKVQNEKSTGYQLKTIYAMAFFLNEHGIFQVGKKIHKYTRNYEYTIDSKDESNLAILQNATSDIEANSGIAKIKTSGDSDARGITHYFLNLPVNYNSTYRVVGQIYKSVTSYNTYYEAYVAHQKWSSTSGYYVNDFGNVGIGLYPLANTGVLFKNLATGHTITKYLPHGYFGSDSAERYKTIVYHPNSYKQQTVFKIDVHLVGNALAPGVDETYKFDKFTMEVWP